MTALHPRGILVAFDGIDGAGKTTQARRLADALCALDFEVIQTKEPTTGTHGALLRASARAGRLPLDQELRLFIADRREHVADVIDPALARGAIVIVDRYYPSTVAYQGARGADPADVLLQNEAFAPRPDVLFLVDVDPALGVSRVRGRDGTENEFEREDDLRRARAIFRTITGPHVVTIDGALPVDQVAKAVGAAVRNGPLFDRLCAVRETRTECESWTCAFASKCQWLRTGSLHPA